MCLAPQDDKPHKQSCGIVSMNKPTIIYEENAACDTNADMLYQE